MRTPHMNDPARKPGGLNAGVDPERGVAFLGNGLLAMELVMDGALRLRRLSAPTTGTEWIPAR